MKYPSILICGMALVAAQSCSQPESNVASNVPDTFIDPANMDTTVNPGDDFFHYANGIWMKNNPIPDKETRWGSFNELREFNAQAVKGLLEDAAAADADEGSIEQRVGVFYTSAMDSTKIEEVGASVIEDDLQRIDGISDIDGVIEESIYQRTHALGSPFHSFYVGQDRKNVEKNMPQLGQGGTTLPDRDYYLVENSRNNDIKEAYKTYVQRLFVLTGSTDQEAADNFNTIWDFEKALATAQKSRVEMRDPQATYNKFSLEELTSSTQPFNWGKILPAFKVEGADTVLVNNPQFFQDEAKLIAATPIEDLKVYLKWNVLKNAASLLSEDFVDANFTFSQALSGQKVITPRWQRSFNLIDRNIGDLLGQLYVAKYFTPDAKARMDELVNNLSETFGE